MKSALCRSLPPSFFLSSSPLFSDSHGASPPVFSSSPLCLVFCSTEWNFVFIPKSSHLFVSLSLQLPPFSPCSPSSFLLLLHLLCHPRVRSVLFCSVLFYRWWLAVALRCHLSQQSFILIFPLYCCFFFFSCSANPVIPVFISWWGYGGAIVILEGVLAPFSPILVSPMCIAVLLIHRKGIYCSQHHLFRGFLVLVLSSMLATC